MSNETRGTAPAMGTAMGTATGVSSPIAGRPGNTEPSRSTLTRWLIAATDHLVRILGLSVLARIGDQLAGIALFVIGARAVLRAAGLTAPAPDTHPALPGLGALLITLIAVALAKALLRYLEHYAGHWVAFTALQRLRELFFSRLIPQAPAATTGRASAELTGRATRDIDRIEVFFAHTFPPAVTAVVVPAVAIIWVGVAVDSLLALVLAVFTIAVLLVSLLSGGGAWESARSVAADRGRISAHLGDDLAGQKEILAFAAQDSRLAGLDAEDAALVRRRSRAGRHTGIRSGVIRALQLLSLVTVLACGTFVADVDADHVIVALAVAIGLWTPAKGINDFVDGLDTSFAAAARVYQVCQATPSVTDPIQPDLWDGEAAARSALGAELADVTFRYAPGDPAALTEVSLGVKPGGWTYLVGVSGSGKSTVADLLLRGWDPETGIVAVDERDVTTVWMDDLRAHVALVPQKPVLVTGSLAENLRLGNPGAGPDTLWNALSIVGLANWAAGLKQGLDTPIHGHGAGISGGQAQRVALARALVARPGLLILDEALSQLDAQTAGAVRAALKGLAGLTILEITHRTDLIDDDSPVVVLDAGRVLDHGLAGKLRAWEDSAFNRLEARN